MRGRTAIVLGLALAGLTAAGCSGDDDKQSASAPAQTTETVTVTTPAKDKKSSAEKKRKKAKAEQKKSSGSSSATSSQPSGSGTIEPKSESGGKRDTSGTKVPAGEVMATNDSPPEVTLAVIDAKSAYVKKSLVHRYAVQLDRLEQSCGEPRVALAEYGLTASRDTQGAVSILQVLTEVADSHPSGACSDEFTKVANAH